MKILYGIIICNLSEMVVEKDKGKVLLGYLLQFLDPMTFGNTLKWSKRKRKDKHIIRQLEKELEKAKDTIACQYVQVHSGRSHQLKLQDMKGESNQAEGKLARLKEELDSRIQLARQIKANFWYILFEKGLVDSEEDLHCQRENLSARRRNLRRQVVLDTSSRKI